MPELPEVEAVARTLRPLVERRGIRCVHVLHAIATKPQNPSHLARTAEGQRIQSVKRKGKYLWLHLERGIVTLHFKLDGQLIWFPSAKIMFDVANLQESGVHVDVAFELDKAFSASQTGVILGASTLMNPKRHAPLSPNWVSMQYPRISPSRISRNYWRARDARSRSSFSIKPASQASATFIPANHCGTRSWIRAAVQIR